MKRLRTSPAPPMQPANRKSALLAMAAVALVALAGVPLGEAATSPPQDPLRREITNYKTDESDISLALQEASYKYSVPLGIEADVQGLGARRTSVSISQGTVADVFRALVQQAPNYMWIESSGVMNVMPRHNPRSVLDITVSRFRVKNATPNAVHVAIVSLPEVKAWMNENQVAVRDFATTSILTGRDGRTDQPQVSLSVKNMTLRDILNTIVKRRGWHVWVVGRYDDHNQRLSISVD